MREIFYAEASKITTFHLNCFFKQKSPLVTIFFIHSENDWTRRFGSTFDPVRHPPSRLAVARAKPSAGWFLSISFCITKAFNIPTARTGSCSKFSTWLSRQIVFRFRFHQRISCICCYYSTIIRWEPQSKYYYQPIAIKSSRCRGRMCFISS